MSALTSEQDAFLEECNLEFSERYTLGDLEFKQIFEADIPKPPIVFPWYGRSRFNRDRGGYNQFNRERERHRDMRHDYDDRGGRSSGYKRSYDNDQGDSSHEPKRKFRPF